MQRDSGSAQGEYIFQFVHSQTPSPPEPDKIAGLIWISSTVKDLFAGLSACALPI
jgi:hypothetical protein